MTDPTPTGSGIGRRGFPGATQKNLDLLAVADAVRTSVASSSELGMILSHVANGLTGQCNGYVERAAARAMAQVYADVVATPEEVLKEREQLQWKARGGPDPLVVIENVPLTLELLAGLRRVLQPGMTLSDGLAAVSR